MLYNTARVPSFPSLLDQLCSLPPETMFQVLVAKYVSVGTLAVFIWDILNHIPSDYELLSEHRIRFPTVIYFLSRLSCVGFVIGNVIIQTLPISRCDLAENALEILFPLTIILSSLLFFFRIRAVFERNLWVVAFFACSWLAVVAGYVTFIVRIEGEKSIPGLCRVLPHVKSFIKAATIISLVNDTFVFLAISWRLFYNSYGPRTIRNSVRVLILGDYLPVFSKAMLQDGQFYYLITVTTSLLTVIMLFVQSISAILQAVFIVPNVVIMNIMACRVFRNTMLGLFREVETSSNGILRDLDAVR
ncbi:hypothetical protein BYT27DRAFT_7191384 [Phlegmacium glaucopus]|nr:hypothetical protein BYT27DRAFT_7191384 [Phlegmacium glaucopus]